MRKGASGRKHSVRCTVTVPELTKAGSSVSFEVYADGEKIGTIIIGRGSLTSSTSTSTSMSGSISRRRWPSISFSRPSGSS